MSKHPRVFEKYFSVGKKGMRCDVHKKYSRDDFNPHFENSLQKIKITSTVITNPSKNQHKIVKILKF